MKSLPIGLKIALALWTLFTVYQLLSLDLVARQTCAYARTADRYDRSGPGDIKLLYCD